MPVRFCFYNDFPERARPTRAANAFLVLGESLPDALVSDISSNVPGKAANELVEDASSDTMVCLGDIGHVSKHGPRSIA